MAGPPKLLFGTADVTDPSSWSRFVAPQSNWVQQTFEHGMVPTDGNVEVAIFNANLFGETGVSVRYDRSVMPRYIEWRMMGEGQYAVGIEPCTNGFGREQVKADGEMIVLLPGEGRTYETRLAIIDTNRAEEIRSTATGAGAVRISNLTPRRAPDC